VPSPTICLLKSENKRFFIVTQNSS
jgi:hypothetical protein